MIRCEGCGSWGKPPNCVVCGASIGDAHDHSDSASMTRDVSGPVAAAGVPAAEPAGGVSTAGAADTTPAAGIQAPPETAPTTEVPAGARTTTAVHTTTMPQSRNRNFLLGLLIGAVLLLAAARRQLHLGQ